MKPLIVLISVFVIALFVIKVRTQKINWRLAARVAMSTMLIFTAVAHFVFTEGMTQMIPDFLPWKEAIVYLTGVLEILFAIGLLVPSTKIITAWTLILFFLVVFPSNIKAAMQHINYQTGELDGNGIEYLWFRIPLQVLFIAWVYYVSIRNN